MSSLFAPTDASSSEYQEDRRLSSNDKPKLEKPSASLVLSSMKPSPVAAPRTSVASKDVKEALQAKGNPLGKTSSQPTTPTHTNNNHSISPAPSTDNASTTASSITSTKRGRGGVMRVVKSLMPGGKKSKRVRVVEPPAPAAANETTPLVTTTKKGKHRSRSAALPSCASTTPPFVTDNLSVDSLPDENPRAVQLRQRAQQGWQRIAAEVKNGGILLLGATGPERTTAMSTDDRERERERAQEWIRKGVEFNLAQCLLAVFLYIGIAIAAFSFVLDDWTCIDSIYFAIVTFTTIGYGDLVPDSYVTRIFTCFFALSGVACLGIAIGVIGTNVMEAQEKAVERTKKMAQHRVLNLFGSSSSNNKSPSSPTAESDGETDEATTTTLGSSVTGTSAAENTININNNIIKSNPFWQLLFHFCLVLVILVIFAFCVASDPGIDVDEVNIFDAMYYTIITASTVGYGDYAPQTQHGRLIAIIFIPLSVGAMGHFLSSVATVIMDSRRSSFQRKMDTHELSMQDLEVMDYDGDGLVTRAEYLEFMLIAMNKVDKEFIDEIRASFARLDTDGTGSLSKEDMVAAARLKLQTSTRKLELARYKEYLLVQADNARKAAKARAENRHSRTGSFWEDNFAFVSKVFAKDEIENHSRDQNSHQKHPLLR